MHCHMHTVPGILFSSVLFQSVNTLKPTCVHAFCTTDCQCSCHLSSESRLVSLALVRGAYLETAKWVILFNYATFKFWPIPVQQSASSPVFVNPAILHVFQYNIYRGHFGKKCHIITSTVAYVRKKRKTSTYGKSMTGSTLRGEFSVFGQSLLLITEAKT
jgi:hypothetical protein